MANGVFSGCGNLSSVTIGNGLAAIGDEMFHNCTNLSSVTIGTNVKSIGQKAFALCPGLTDVYCYPQYPPATGTDTFADSYIQFVTLHVPATSVSAYQAVSPWKDFVEIVELNEMPLANKCATPTIDYADGVLTFACDTEDAECVWTLNYIGRTQGRGNTVNVPNQFELTVYAAKEGWQDSDRVTATLVWGDAEVSGTNIIRLGGMSNGGYDVNGDGKVDVADITTIISSMTNR